MTEGQEQQNFVERRNDSISKFCNYENVLSTDNSTLGQMRLNTEKKEILGSVPYPLRRQGALIKGSAYYSPIQDLLRACSWVYWLSKINALTVCLFGYKSLLGIQFNNFPS